jgi:SAM-dependent methyltransferase
MTGDYGLASRCTEKDAKEFVARLKIKPGKRLLDAACGVGQIALLAARAGAVVTGCDIATNWLEQARARARTEGLAITFEEGDVECLPYADHQLDAVVTRFGAIFAPTPEFVAAELTRVCRPGGMIAIANWTPRGFSGQMFRIISEHIAPSGMPAPVLWGDEDIVRDRLRKGIAGLECTPRICRFEYPFPPEEAVEFFRVNYGPMARAFASLDATRQSKMRTAPVRRWSAHNCDAGGGTQVDSEYLEVSAIRG